MDNNGCLRRVGLLEQVANSEPETLIAGHSRVLECASGPNLQTELVLGRKQHRSSMIASRTVTKVSPSGREKRPKVHSSRLLIVERLSS